MPGRGAYMITRISVDSGGYGRRGGLGKDVLVLGRRIAMGVAAGAVGTAALNITTYADMVVRGRGSSGVPAQAAAQLVEKAGIDLGEDEAKQNRQTGLGALLGYVTGLGIGGAYGAARPLLRSLPQPLVGVLLGAGAMAGSDVPATALGITDPTEWPAQSWASDIVPHLVYGIVTAVAYDAFGSD